MTYVLLIVGFVLLVKGADFFVSGTSSIAKALRVPSIIIGLTIVAFGTSAPEAAVSITAALKGSNDIALGNVIGSNIFNLLVVAGVSAAIIPLTLNASLLKRDFPLSILAAVILLLLAAVGGSLSRVDGLVLIAVFGWFLYSTITEALRARSLSGQEAAAGEKPSMVSAAVLSVIGLIGVIAGGNFVVDSATTIAKQFHVSESLIGLTIVAIGTSLPELVTSLVAAKKGEPDIAMGNVIGSNIFNIVCILGLSAALHPIQTTGETLIDTMVLIVVSAVVFLGTRREKKLKRPLGLAMAAVYVCYTVYIILR